MQKMIEAYDRALLNNSEIQARRKNILKLAILKIGIGIVKRQL